MIGRQDWHEMARQVYELEKQMQSIYEDLEKKVADPELKAIFARLGEDEQSHATAIKDAAEKVARA